MKTRWIVAGAVVSGLLLSAGCSATGAAWTGLRVGQNVARKDSYLKIWLDGQLAQQNTLKKAATGYSAWSVGEQVANAPQLKFEIEDPARFGRITQVIMAIHQKHQADYSHQAEYKIFARDTNNPDAQFKPNTAYDLGNLGSNFKVLNLTNQEVSGVRLTPGMDYMLVLTVVADKSETAQIYFTATGSKGSGNQTSARGTGTTSAEPS